MMPRQHNYSVYLFFYLNKTIPFHNHNLIITPPRQPVTATSGRYQADVDQADVPGSFST